MRTTLSIDDDLLDVAKSLARAKSVPLGRAVSDLMRRGLNATPRVNDQGTRIFPVFRVSADSPPITLEDVKKLEDEM